MAPETDVEEHIKALASKLEAARQLIHELDYVIAEAHDKLAAAQQAYCRLLILPGAADALVFIAEQSPYDEPLP